MKYTELKLKKYVDQISAERSDGLSVSWPDRFGLREAS